MKIQRMLLWLLVITTCMAGFPHFTRATIQSTKPYQQMTLPERGAFVSEQARRLARALEIDQRQAPPGFEHTRNLSESLPFEAIGHVVHHHGAQHDRMGFAPRRATFVVRDAGQSAAESGRR